MSTRGGRKDAEASTGGASFLVRRSERGLESAETKRRRRITDFLTGRDTPEARASISTYLLRNQRCRDGGPPRRP